MNSFYTATDHFVLLPALLLAMFGCAILLFDFWVFPEPKQRKWLLIFLVLGELFAGVAMWRQQAALSQSGGALTAFGGGMLVDGFGLFFNWLFLAGTILIGLISYRYLEVRDEHHAVISGPTRLRGSDVAMGDLRAGASLILAALAADGRSTISGVHHVRRGYEDIERKLLELGAHIEPSNGEGPAKA